MTMTIPTRFRAICEICKREDQPIDTRMDGVHQWTAGWVMNRTGGGGHGVSLPQRENRWAHGSCVDRVSRGAFGQRSMFG